MSFSAAPRAEPIHQPGGLRAPRRGDIPILRSNNNHPSLHSWQRASSLIFTPLDEWVNLITPFTGKDREKKKCEQSLFFFFFFFCSLGVAYRCPRAATARHPDLFCDVSVRIAGRSAWRPYPRRRFGGRRVVLGQVPPPAWSCPIQPGGCAYHPR